VWAASSTAFSCGNFRACKRTMKQFNHFFLRRASRHLALRISLSRKEAGNIRSGSSSADSNASLSLCSCCKRCSCWVRTALPWFQVFPFPRRKCCHQALQFLVFLLLWRPSHAGTLPFVGLQYRFCCFFNPGHPLFPLLSRAGRVLPGVALVAPRAETARWSVLISFLAKESTIEMRFGQGGRWLSKGFVPLRVEGREWRRFFSNSLTTCSSLACSKSGGP
jgi:hypothetical protein